jgi:hypothetical protein
MSLDNGQKGASRFRTSGSAMGDASPGTLHTANEHRPCTSSSLQRDAHYEVRTAVDGCYQPLGALRADQSRLPNKPCSIMLLPGNDISPVLRLIRYVFPWPPGWPQLPKNAQCPSFSEDVEVRIGPCQAIRKMPYSHNQ